MVRIFIKGGVWRNTEDEILKAAVMKYGKMSWARVASLLSRKSAKQCKARWFEWLDPAIKKTDWTREEEEKLLHLAKLMPNQWRTIAPIVGRTAGQCLEHYERLLDMAQEKEGDVEAAGEARRLRPGEIDPAPETKPARPDPVDMDEDEKEMLQEARARLANTRGKKAKRKAREKQLEEARRLATLQKRRELKAAGIEQTMRQRKRKNIDYGKEIPFQMNAPAGFYDTATEREATKKAKMDPQFSVEYMHKMEEKRRDKEEETERKKDAAKLKKMMKANLPQQIMAVSKLNDPIAVRKRAPLSLPAPQVSDAELEDIVKLGAAAAGGGGGGSEATAGLIGEYRQDRPGATPLRTPATPAGADVIMQEARNMALLNAAQTPLLGGENAALEAGTGFEGSTPRSQRAPATPNALMTPGGGGSEGGATPMRGGVTGKRGREGGETPSRTPMRDQLGLNREDDFMSTPGGSTSSRMERERARRAAAELAAQLQGLPAPQYSYEISLPDVKDDDEKTAQQLEEDAADRDRRIEAARIAQQEAEWRARTQVLKRDLPRPAGVTVSVTVAESDDGEAAAVSRAVQEVAIALLRRDALKYPVAIAVGPDGKKKTKKKKARLNAEEDAAAVEALVPEATEEELVTAKLLVEEEPLAIEGGALTGDALAAFGRAWEAAHEGWAYLPDRKAYGRAADAPRDVQLAALMHEFQVVHAAIARLAGRAEKAEARAGLTQGGYAKRAAEMADAVLAAHRAADDAFIERACYDTLLGNENLAAPRRLADAQAALAVEMDIEAALQKEYAELQDQLKERQEAAAAAAAAVAKAAADKKRAAAEAAHKAATVISAPPKLKAAAANGGLNGAPAAAAPAEEAAAAEASTAEPAAAVAEEAAAADASTTAGSATADGPSAAAGDVTADAGAEALAGKDIENADADAAPAPMDLAEEAGQDDTKDA